jgi:tetratricopeptide (TPR) repeat protein
MYGKADFLGKMLELMEARVAYAEEGDPAYDLLKQGFEHFSRQEYDEAVKCFQKILNEYPKSEYVINALGGIGAALVYKYRFVEKNPEYLEESIEYAKEIIRKFPNTEEAIRAYPAIGSIYIELQNWEKAVVWFERALEKFMERGVDREDIAHVMGALGLAYGHIEEFEKVLLFLQRLLNEYSDTKKVRFSKGAIYEAIGAAYASLEEPDYDKAIEYYKLALEDGWGILDKGHTCFYIAETYHYGKGDKENAKLWYKEVIDNYPYSAYYEKAKKRLEELER